MMMHRLVQSLSRSSHRAAEEGEAEGALCTLASAHERRAWTGRKEEGGRWGVGVEGRGSVRWRLWSRLGARKGKFWMREMRRALLWLPRDRCRGRVARPAILTRLALRCVRQRGGLGMRDSGKASLIALSLRGPFADQSMCSSRARTSRRRRRSRAPWRHRHQASDAEKTVSKRACQLIRGPL